MINLPLMGDWTNGDPCKDCTMEICDACGGCACDDCECDCSGATEAAEAGEFETVTDEDSETESE